MDSPSVDCYSVTSLVLRRIGNARWQSLSDWEPLLFGPEGLRLDQWRSLRPVSVVKHGPHRTVYYVELLERAFYVKHRRCDRFGDVLGHLFRASAARREWRKLTELARRGVPTVKPVAWQEQIRGGLAWDSYLVTEAIQRACSFEEYVLQRLPQLPDQVQQATRRRIIQSLARFTAAIHRAGIVHNDFHLGNILVQPDLPKGEIGGEPGLPPLYLIDAPGVRFSAPLDWPDSRHSLIMLNSAWRELTSRTDRWRFWQTYLRHRPELRLPDQHSALEQIDVGTSDYSRRVARRRDKRALRTNRDYVAIGGPGREAHAVNDLAESELSRLLEDPEALLWQNLHRPVKLGHSSLAVEAELPLSQGAAHVLYKRYRPRNRWKAFWGRFRRTPALRSWCGGHALCQRQIATARPVTVCELGGHRHRRCGYLATEWIEGAENLHLYGWRLATLPPADRLRRAARCAESLGALIGRMHAWGIAHGDLKGSNLLVVERAAQTQTYVIDTDGLEITSRLSSARQAGDLARLAASIQAHPWITRTIACRFFRAYLRQFRPADVDWKSLWREVARRSRRITDRKRRRREPVL